MKDVSIISVVMNRSDRALDAVENWLQSPAVGEIVLIDWSSTPALELPKDPRLRLIRVEDEPYFILTIGFNLAAAMATREILVKMDIDYRMAPNFLESIRLRSGSFVRGKPTGSKDANIQALNGFMAVRAAHFWSIGGYNERIFGYGRDDWDLYKRFVERKLKPQFVRPEFGLWHVPHSDEMRVENMLGDDWKKMNHINHLVAEGRLWTAEDEHVKWTGTEAGLVRHPTHSSDALV